MNTKTDLKDLVRLLYQLVLQRPADDEGCEYYSKLLRERKLGTASLISQLMQSEEHQLRIRPYDYRADPENHSWLTPEVDNFSRKLACCESMGRDQYETVWKSIFARKKSLIIGQQEYGNQHKERFWELLNTMKLLFEKMTCPKMLEFGISEFSGFYKEIFPEIEFTTSDRPVAEDYIGFTPEICRKISRCNQHIPLDLCDYRALQEFGHIHARKYDLLLLTEVLEHLTIHPLDILRPLLQTVKAEGHLYLTTPNFFRSENRILMADWKNPQEFYPSQEDNWDAHHHYREYCQKEMVNIIQKAGGKIDAFYFSSCWDKNDFPCEAERGNMVFLISPADSTLIERC